MKAILTLLIFALGELHLIAQEWPAVTVSPSEILLMADIDYVKLVVKGAVGRDAVLKIPKALQAQNRAVQFPFGDDDKIEILFWTKPALRENGGKVRTIRYRVTSTMGYLDGEFRIKEEFTINGKRKSLDKKRGIFRATNGRVDISSGGIGVGYLMSSEGDDLGYLFLELKDN
jgi:hypothetical protein